MVLHIYSFCWYVLRYWPWKWQ